MRSGSLLLSAALLSLRLLDTSWAQAAPPKKAPAAVRAKPRASAKPPAHAPEAEAPADAASDSDNPYLAASAQGAAATGDAAAPAPSASGRAEAGPAAAGAAGDPKLDERPPPSTGSDAKKMSPLNPEPPESPKAAPPPGPAPLDGLIADIAALRARVAALTTSLFSSKLKIYVHTDGDDARILSFSVTLDDGVVFRGDTGFMAEDEKVVYEHAVAPGSHVVGIEIERQDTRGATYRTWQTTRFALQVPEKKVLEAIVVVEDDSDMADDFPDDQDGKYKLGVRLRAKVME
jgi:hypothetical protein